MNASNEILKQGSLVDISNIQQQILEKDNDLIQ